MEPLLEFKVLLNENDFQQAFPIMKQLRPHLDEKTYLSLLRIARSESGYTLLGVFSQHRGIGLMGYRLLTDFVHGRHLYIDDLVVIETYQSQGVGAKFLIKAKEIATNSGCSRIRLCTGIENIRGMAFYDQQGWSKKAVVYKINL